MKITQRDNRITFIFKNHNFLLINTMENVWRLISEKDGKFDLMGAAQIISKDLGEDYETPVLPVNAVAGDDSYVIISDSAISFFRPDEIVKLSR